MRIFLRSSAAALLLALVPFANAMEASAIPKPFVIAPECTAEQRGTAVAVAQVTERVLACFQLEKWSFKGVALLLETREYADRPVSREAFRQLQRQVFRDQSVRLRTERDLREALPDQPPPHASTPLSLFVRTRTPLGVFLDEANHIGFADLVPLQLLVGRPVRAERYPLIQLETLVLSQTKVFRLIQIAPIHGPSTIGEGFRMADDWARRFNGSERLATED